MERGFILRFDFVFQIGNYLEEMFGFIDYF